MIKLKLLNESKRQVSDVLNIDFSDMDAVEKLFNDQTFIKFLVRDFIINILTPSYRKFNERIGDYDKKFIKQYKSIDEFEKELDDIERFNMLARRFARIISDAIMNKMEQYHIEMLAKNIFLTGKVEENVINLFQDITLDNKKQTLLFMIDKGFVSPRPKPLIKRMRGGEISNNEIFKTNINKIFSIKNYESKDSYELDSIPSHSYIRHHLIGDEIGKGSYGTVFSFKNNPNLVVKIFQSSFREANDVERMEEIIEDTFSGFASLNEMPYFELIKIQAKPDQYYADDVYASVMPKIIPFGETDEYNNRRYYFDHLFEKIRGSLVSRGYINYEAYKNILLELFNEEKRQSNQERAEYYNSFITALNNDQSIETKIAKACFHARRKYKGIDFKANNTGFLKQKPDIFFLFDM
jgi:hypothetical protein